MLDAGDGATVLTNVFTGRPARGLVNRLVRDIGPLSPDAPLFPLAAGALTRQLAADALQRLRGLARPND